MRTGLVVGFLGDYTTFSTFAQEGLDLMREGQSAVALLYAVGSVLLGLVAVYAGMAVGRVLWRLVDISKVIDTMQARWKPRCR